MEEDTVEVNTSIVDKKSKPFDAKFVLNVTLINMKSSLRLLNEATDGMYRAIDQSIDITLSRLPEFEGDIEKSNEAFKALSDLHSLRKQVDSLVIVKKFK